MNSGGCFIRNPHRSITRPCCFFFQRIRQPPTPTLFPYTTLFRSAATCWPGRPAAAAPCSPPACWPRDRSEEHTSELQSQSNLVCRLLLEKKKFVSKQ